MMHYGTGKHGNETMGETVGRGMKKRGNERDEYRRTSFGAINTDFQIKLDVMIISHHVLRTVA
jgi:hypothetical protein